MLYSSISLLQPSDVSTLPTEGLEPIRERFRLFREVVDSSSDPLERMFLSSPSIFALVMGTREETKLYPEEAHMIPTALKRVGLQDDYVLVLEGEEDDELRSPGEPQVYVATIYNDDRPEITFVTKDRAKSRGVRLTPVDLSDITYQGATHVAFRLEGELQAVDGGVFEEFPRGGSYERFEHYLGYLDPYLGRHSFINTRTMIRMIDQELGVINYVNGVRAGFTKPGFVNRLLENVGYQWPG